MKTMEQSARHQWRLTSGCDINRGRLTRSGMRRSRKKTIKENPAKPTVILGGKQLSVRAQAETSKE